MVVMWGNGKDLLKITAHVPKRTEKNLQNLPVRYSCPVRDSNPEPLQFAAEVPITAP
jgi:hypothetical protein